ncbi:TetR/AcrR family transcriptional regulator [Microbacterium sediminicola]|uniref:TetR/AcrR family transcriptional regulator n=1 Tax=Microbacterium sediminicola TaxID=415210 RepID=A0ABN2HGL2_9MICO
MSTSEPRASYHHGDLRNALLDAADDLLSEGSADGVALRAVARRAGVSHTAAYNHFEDRTDLLRAVALRAFGRLQTDLERVAADGASTVGDIAAAYLRYATGYPRQFTLMFDRALCRPDGEEDELAAAGDAASATVRGFVAARTGLSGEELDVAALALWAQVHGLATLVVETPALKSVAPEAAEGIARALSAQLVFGRP